MSIDRGAERVAIIGGLRTPFCRAFGAYKELSNLDMLGVVLRAMVEKFSLKNKQLGEVIAGAVITHSKDWNLAREAVIDSGLAQTTPGVTMQQACGTGLQAALSLAAKIQSGQIECGIAVGSDSISDAPVVFSRRFAHRLAAVSKARRLGDKLRAFKKFSFGELLPQPPIAAEPHTSLSMGEHCELMAKKWGIPRKAQDELALASHQKTEAAYREGFMDDLLVPCVGIFEDDNLRKGLKADELSALHTAFDKSAAGSITAGNSSPLTDGAAGVLLTSERWAEQNGLKPMAWLSHSATTANDFVGGEGLLMAPVRAVAMMLRRANARLQDFDVYEIHEAFSAQVLATLAAWENAEYCRLMLGVDGALGGIDRDKMNPKGGSVAIGHPFAATGARILSSMAKQLQQRGGGKGLISICTAGGMGVTAILEA